MHLPLKLLLQIHDGRVFETPAGTAEAHAGIVCAESVNNSRIRVRRRSGSQGEGVY